MEREINVREYSRQEYRDKPSASADVTPNREATPDALKILVRRLRRGPAAGAIQATTDGPSEHLTSAAASCKAQPRGGTFRGRF